MKLTGQAAPELKFSARVAWDNDARAFIATDPTRRGCRATGFTALVAVKNLELEQATFDQARSAK